MRDQGAAGASDSSSAAQSTCGVVDRGRRVADATARRDVDVRGGEVDRGVVREEHALHVREEALPLGGVERRRLLLHQRVDLGFPRRRRRVLARVPHVVVSVRQPPVEVSGRIRVAQQEVVVDRVVVALAPVLQHRRHVEADDVHADADLRELVADELHALLARGDARLHQDGEAHGMARGVLADAVVVAIDEAEAVEQRRGARGIVRGRRHPVGQPRAVRPPAPAAPTGRPRRDTPRRRRPGDRPPARSPRGSRPPAGTRGRARPSARG